MSDLGVGIDLGPVDLVPVGEGRTFAVDGTQVAVFRLRDGSLRAITRSARTAAVRSPTA